MAGLDSSVLVSVLPPLRYERRVTTTAATTRAEKKAVDFTRMRDLPRLTEEVHQKHASDFRDGMASSLTLCLPFVLVSALLCAHLAWLTQLRCTPLAYRLA